jgi:hypothetical protein
MPLGDLLGTISVFNRILESFVFRVNVCES